MANSELPADAPAPRLCHLVKWPDFDGYGFNLHAEKAKTGQFIGKVDEGSPAEKAGLREGDRIVEVNGVNIANENHRQVVERIKAMVNETKLLVLDEGADKWYKERNLVVKGTQANVIYKKTPASQTETSKNEEVQLHHVNSTNGIVEVAAEVVTPPVKEAKKTEEITKTLSQTSIEENGGNKRVESEKNVVNGKTPPSQPAKKEEVKETAPQAKVEPQNGTATNGSGAIINNNNNSLKKANNASSQGAPLSQNTASPPAPAASSGKDDLNLNMSAAQMREMLANRKKRDPRKQNLDMKEKYQIVQQM